MPDSSTALLIAFGSCLIGHVRLVVMVVPGNRPPTGFPSMDPRVVRSPLDRSIPHRSLAGRSGPNRPKVIHPQQMMSQAGAPIQSSPASSSRPSCSGSTLLSVSISTIYHHAASLPPPHYLPERYPTFSHIVQLDSLHHLLQPPSSPLCSLYSFSVPCSCSSRHHPS